MSRKEEDQIGRSPKPLLPGGVKLYKDAPKSTLLCLVFEYGEYRVLGSALCAGAGRKSRLFPTVFRSKEPKEQ